MRNSLGTVLLCGLLLAGCGESGSDFDSNSDSNFDGHSNNSEATDMPTDTESIWLACDDDEAAADLTGMVYVDSLGRATSAYDQPFEGAGREGVEIRVFSSSGEVSTTTCADGGFQAAGLDSEAYYLVDASIDEKVLSSNDTRVVYDAVASQDLNLLVFGDSLPKYGPTPWFPNLLADHFEELAPTTMTNVAVPGSETSDWLPGQPFFKEELKPKLADADVIVFSLGGNDLRAFGESVQRAEFPAQEVAKLQPEVDAMVVRLRIIIAEIQELAPGADLVWILYPNYALSDEWQALLGEFGSAAKPLVHNLIRNVRKDLAQIEGLIIVDMLSLLDADTLNSILLDPVHLNVLGHEYYASEVFRTLGGIEPGAISEWSFALPPTP